MEWITAFEISQPNYSILLFAETVSLNLVNNAIAAYLTGVIIHVATPRLACCSRMRVAQRENAATSRYEPESLSSKLQFRLI